MTKRVSSEFSGLAHTLEKPAATTPHDSDHLYDHRQHSEHAVKMVSQHTELTINALDILYDSNCACGGGSRGGLNDLATSTITPPILTGRVFDIAR